MLHFTKKVAFLEKILKLCVVTLTYLMNFFFKYLICKIFEQSHSYTFRKHTLTQTVLIYHLTQF